MDQQIVAYMMILSREIESAPVGAVSRSENCKRSGNPRNPDHHRGWPI